MSLRYLYQTLEDRSNIDEIENNGPFLCKNKNAWLGIGYYFWDTSINTAHWWGKKSYKNSYIICKSQYNYNSEVFLDLVGNTNHIDIIKTNADLLYKKSGIHVTVSMTIEFLKRQTQFLQIFKAIRAYPIYSRDHSHDYLFFKENHSAFIDLDPPIQMCVIDKSFLYKNKFEIIYPEIYCNDYLV